MIVLDTSALIYWLTIPGRLSSAAEIAIEEAGLLYVSSISVWELALKVRQDRLVLPRPLDRFVAELEVLNGVAILPVDAGLWIDSVLLDWDHRDPADRVIVALARRLACPLITSDRRIAGFYPNTVW